jgi:hypothetical protein
MLCSGALVSERVVLTARHCVSDADHDVLEVMFGADRNDDDSFVLGARVLALHPGSDVAAWRSRLHRESDGISSRCRSPRALPTGLATDTLVQIAGYGYQADVRGQRAFLVEHVEQLAGDSRGGQRRPPRGRVLRRLGGPLLMRDDAGASARSHCSTRAPATAAVRTATRASMCSQTGSRTRPV